MTDDETPALATLPTAPLTTIGSNTTAALAGITYRQLDYLTRTTPQLRHLAVGTGGRRHYPLDVALRIHIAARLADVVAHLPARDSMTSTFPQVAACVLAGPAPPAFAGLAALTGSGDVVYPSSAGDLLDEVMLSGLVVAGYDLARAAADAVVSVLVPVPSWWRSGRTPAELEAIAAMA